MRKTDNKLFSLVKLGKTHIVRDLLENETPRTLF